MKNCTYTLGLKEGNPLNLDHVSFNNERDLEIAIKNHLEYFLQESDTDFKFSKDLGKTTVDMLTNIHESASEKLSADRAKALENFEKGKKLALQNGQEEEVTVYGDSYKSVVEYILESLKGEYGISKFNLQAWRNAMYQRLAEKDIYKGMPQETKDKAINQILDDTVSSWDYIQDIGRGVHRIMESIFKDPETRPNYDQVLRKIKRQIEKEKRRDVSIQGISEVALTEFISNMYRIRTQILKNPNKKVAKIIPEFTIDHDGDPKLRGKMDLVVAYKDGSVDIIDLKLSTHHWSDWDQDKNVTINYQLGFYKRLLESKGITGDISLKILPIQITGFNKDNRTIQGLKFDSLRPISPTVTEQRTINELIDADPRAKVSTDELTTSTIKDLSGMFGVTSFTDSFKSATFEHYFKRQVSRDSSGRYSFINRVDRGQAIYAATEEEAREKFKAYLELQADDTKRLTGVIASNLSEALGRIGQNKNLVSSNFNIIPHGFGRSNEMNNWLNNEFAKYKDSPGWKVFNNDELLTMGVIVMINDVTHEYDLISISPDSLHSSVDLKLGKTILGNFYTDRQVGTNKNILDSTIGNIELMKLMNIANKLNLGADYKISDMKALNMYAMEDFTYMYNEKLKENYATLANKVGAVNTNVQFTDEYTKTFTLYKDIMGYENQLRAIGVNPAELEKAGIDFDKPITKAEKLEKLKELYKAMTETFYTSKKADSDTSLIGDLYRQVALAIARIEEVGIDYHNYKHMPEYFGNILRQFQDGTLLNSTQLNTLDTVPVIKNISDKIFQTNRVITSKYTAYKNRDRRITNEFYSNNGNPLLSNKLLNNYEIAFTNLFDKSERGRKRMLLKDYRTDTSLNTAEKKYLEYWLKELNAIRYPGEDMNFAEDPEKFFEVPLMRGSYWSRISNGESNIKYLKDNAGIELVDPRMEMGVVSGNSSQVKGEILLDSMYNAFELSENAIERMKMLESANSDPEKVFETNLERIKDMYMLSKLRKAEYDKVLPTINAALTALATYSFMSNQEIQTKPVIDLVRDYIKSAVLDMSLVSEENKDAYRILGALKSTSSKMILGLNFLSGAKETTVGWFTLYNQAIANSLADKDRFGVADATKAYAMVWGDAAKQLGTITLGERLNFLYGMANMSPDELVSRQNFNKGEFLRLNDKLFWFNRAPDFLHRMTVLYAYMNKMGAMDAHKIEGDKLIYDWKKDKRFEAYAKGDKSNIHKYNEQRALFERMKEDMIAEKVQVIDWEAGTSRPLTAEDDFLPQAFTLKEISKIKQEADSMYGYMDSDTKSLFYRKGVGLIIGQFKTFFSAKKNQYFLQRGVYNNGKYTHLTDNDGNKLYWVKDDQGNRIGTTTEVNEFPVIDWQGSMMEGIFWSVKDLFNVFNLSSPEGRRKLREAWKDPVKRRNFYVGLGDALATMLLLLLASMMFGDLTPSEMSYAERNLQSVLKNASSELNVIKAFSGQVEFQFTGWETMTKLAESTGRLISGDTNVQRMLASNFGVFRTFKNQIYDEFPVEQE